MAEQGAQARSDITGSTVAQYAPALRRYFRRRVAAHEVDDLIQEVFANLQGRRSESAVDDMRRYLFVVAGNVLLRKRSHDTRWAAHQAPDAWEHREEASPERTILGRERLGRAIGVIANLPVRTRQVFILHRFEDMTYQRIGEQLGISVSAVEKHIMAALKALLREADT